MSHRSTLLAGLGWPQDITAGSMSWEHQDSEGRNGVSASATLTPSGEIVMSSMSTFNDRRQTRFSAHIPEGSDVARVSMPGYQAHQMPAQQAVSLFHAHVQSIQAEPAIRRSGPSAPRM